MKTVMFDLDDTLLWDEKSIRQALTLTCAFAAEETGVSASALNETVIKKAPELYAEYPMYEFTKMIGINPFEGLWGDFNDEGSSFEQMNAHAPEYRRRVWTESLAVHDIYDEALGEVLAETFRLKRKENPYLFDDALPILDQLQDDCSLILLTNGSPELQNIKLNLTPELAPYFNRIIISGDFGRGKPDTAIFEHALQSADAFAEDTIMVGDNLNTDIRGANAANITSVWLNRFNKPNKTDVKPDHTIESLDELKTLLEQIN
ncbi:HAD family hydrolase [Salisediminibacterium halotolerans]|uniref:Phosphoserine phosphatase n=1 Tax=Salisediminibacterium halotolerans TaxID=517425 RepID=A0A1H9UX00_9BACI|nr:HAD family hydrolase [Salisediminibacterium haloalkalitolerans]SES13553.1 putative hydrolase of the HAD superfamily [Salisediminibacterium haloalkalitolerans]